MFKKLVLVLSLSLVASSAFASVPTRNDDWNTILASTMISTDLPYVAFGTTSVRADGVCRDGENSVRTIREIAVCTGGQNFGGDLTCEVSRLVLRRPITALETVCLEWDPVMSSCNRLGKAVTTLPLTHKVNVYTAGDALDVVASRTFLFQKAFTVSNCQ